MEAVYLARFRWEKSEEKRIEELKKTEGEALNE